MCIGLTGANRDSWTDYLYAIFLLGSATGGLLAGTLADRYGRRPLLVATILFYSIFAGLMYFVTDLWHVCIIRFLVAMGIGGEWAVGAALVAETFPKRARAYTSGMFHSSSVIWAFGWPRASASIVGRELAHTLISSAYCPRF